MDPPLPSVWRGTRQIKLSWSLVSVPLPSAWADTRQSVVCRVSEKDTQQKPSLPIVSREHSINTVCQVPSYGTRQG
jgi:hypothetical protein